MGREIFGTDGIRGPAGVFPLDEVGSRQVGKAIATYFAKPGQRILVGRDPRESSTMLERALSEGIASIGVDVLLLGVVPTAGLAYLTHKTGAQAGVMITASHNPYTDNGIKVFSPEGTKLPDNVEVKLNELIEDHIADSGQGSIANSEILIKVYEDFLVSTAGDTDFSGLRIVLDCANGATSFIADKLFERLQAQVTPLFNHPNGKNINDHCGATNTTSLQETVKSQDYDCGIAFDGDGDRLMLVDNKGRTLSGDHILYILALCLKKIGVVATFMSNMGLEKALQSHGITLKRTAVGDRYVLEGLEQTGYSLGGEQSGHIIMQEYYTTGDGLLTAIQTLKQVKTSGKSLAEWFDEVTLWPQALVSIPLTSKKDLDHPMIQAYISSQRTLLGESGRLSIRPSGTEPLLRVMVESQDAQQKAQTIAAQLSALISNNKDSA